MSERLLILRYIVLLQSITTGCVRRNVPEGGLVESLKSWTLVSYVLDSVRMSRVFFPVTEILGHATKADTPQRSGARSTRRGPFAGAPREEGRHYPHGHCSVVYSAAVDWRNRYTYAACDYRLDSPPDP